MAAIDAERYLEAQKYAAGASKGKPEPDDPTSGVVEYSFACSQAITGYMVQPDKQATGYDTEVFGADPKTKEVIATDAFSCSGDIPGFGVNCTGSYNGNWETVASRFTVDGNVCAEPRVDPLLIVTYASANSAGKASGSRLSACNTRCSSR